MAVKALEFSRPLTALQRRRCQVNNFFASCLLTRLVDMSTIGTDLDRHLACLLDKQKDDSLDYSVFTYGRPSIQSVIR